MPRRESSKIPSTCHIPFCVCPQLVMLSVSTMQPNVKTGFPQRGCHGDSSSVRAAMFYVADSSLTLCFNCSFQWSLTAQLRVPSLFPLGWVFFTIAILLICMPSHISAPPPKKKHNFFFNGKLH